MAHYNNQKCVYSFRDTITEFADLFFVFIPVSPQSSFIFVNFPTSNLLQKHKNMSQQFALIEKNAFGP